MRVHLLPATTSRIAADCSIEIEPSARDERSFGSSKTRFVAASTERKAASLSRPNGSLS